MARKKAEAQAPASALARAREALERGNVRRARQLLADQPKRPEQGRLVKQLRHG